MSLIALCSGRPRSKNLAGGSTRLRPLILADGLLEIPAEVSDLKKNAGDVPRFR
jgi:hypothetical protein